MNISEKSPLLKSRFRATSAKPTSDWFRAERAIYAFNPSCQHSQRPYGDKACERLSS